MLNTLIKKQYQECFRSYFVNPKTGKRRSKWGIFGMFAFFTAIMLFLAGMFFGLAFFIGDALFEIGMDWLYYVLMGILSVLLGTFGSVFNTYSTLYLAKDNDLLLSMPIPTRTILLARLSGVYAMGLLYELIVMVPALIVYYIAGSPTPLSVVFSLLLPLLLSVVVLTLSCALGWVVAIVSSRIRHKNLITVVLSLAFIAA